MGIRFNKSIKIGKYFRLNFSKSGVSATVGKKGASINLGKKGTYVNVSPTAVGVTGTGLSYRQKITGSLLPSGKKKAAKKSEDKKTSSLKKKGAEVIEERDEIIAEDDVFAEYAERQEAMLNLHKYAPDVRNKEQFRKFVDKIESESLKELYEAAILGDEDVIENLVSTFMNELKLDYTVRVNYELEDTILYVDLDLPEIEDFDNTYPAESKGKIVTRRKSGPQMKEEYARLIMSLGIFLSASYFNVSSYIEQVVLSAFTTVRNKDGDLEDQYLYTVKYTRDIFENTRLADLDDVFAFFNKFENRIIINANNSFKPIKPYETESAQITNSMINDAIAGLKELGYKTADINKIMDQLSACEFESSGEYLREGLRLLNELKN